MTATVKGIIYEAKTLAIRRIVIPDKNHQLPLHLQRGEAMVTVPIDAPTTHEDLYRYVQQKTGRMPPTLEEVHAADEAARSLGLK